MSKVNKAIPDALRDFAALPDESFVRLPVVRGLYGHVSAPTIWRGVKTGRIPEPRKLTANVTAWNVGALRRALAEAV
jgi:prophage regulatory protein